jgi:hypothetical protein
MCDGRGEKIFSGVNTPQWDFAAFGERFFLPVFAPFYPHQHPRYSCAEESAFIIGIS